MHGNAQWTMFVGLFGGNTVVLNASRRFDADEIWDLVERENVSDHLARRRRDGAPARRRARAPRRRRRRCSRSCRAARSSRPRSRPSSTSARRTSTIVDAFGASETGANGAVDVTDKGPRFRMNEWTTVITDDGDVAPVGEVGLLARRGHVPDRLLQGRGEDRGDVRRDARRALGDPRRPRGDRGRRHDHVLGRGSQCINTGGEKVFPEEVEAVLKSHPDVFDAIVVGVPDERWGECVAAVVAPRHRSHRHARHARRARRTALAGYKVPRHLVVVDEVERTPAGKPNYRWAKEKATATLSS